MLPAMFRLALVSIVVAGCSCSKSATQQDTGAAGNSAGAVGTTVSVPGAKGAKLPGPDLNTPPGGETMKAGGDDSSKLHADEGKLAIDAGDFKAGAEGAATITVTPAAGYHVNTEYPIELTLTAPSGVTLAKTKLSAGGMDKAKGDAATLEEKSLVLPVKLTPAAAGTYTVNGTFKFAVCQDDACHPKKETVAIQVAAK